LDFGSDQEIIVNWHGRMHHGSHAILTSWSIHPFLQNRMYRSRCRLGGWLRLP